MDLDVEEVTPRTCVIGVPQLSRLLLRLLDIPDLGEDSDAIRNHGQRLPLCHTLLYVQEVTLTPPYVVSTGCPYVSSS